MTIITTFLKIKLAIFQAFTYLIEKIARIFFNYPSNPGMSIVDLSIDPEKRDYLENLPYATSTFPPLALPETLVEAFIGNYPNMQLIQKTFYEHPIEGFYNFYLINYSNMVFLPDWLSKFIQLNFNITTDDTFLVSIQEALLLGLLSFAYLLEFRMKLYWYLTINPYTKPWIYIITLTDWIFDLLSGSIPVILGLDTSAMVILGIYGRIMDGANKLVFTMPFLPSEGIPGKMSIKGQLTDVLVFRYLPSLWYQYPIPNDLREFWYTKKPDILTFMQKNYGQLDINFLPDRIVKELIEKEQINKSLISTINTLLSFEIPNNVFPDCGFF